MTLVPVNGTAIAAPTALGQSELDTLRRTIGHDLDNNEFELFAAICRRTGLDPFARQIYAVKRYDKRQGREVMQIQTGIDGLRLIAERSRHYAGQTPVEWCGPDGNWVDVWLSDQPPAAARVGVLRDDFREPVYAVAKFSSYCATTRDGKPQSLWATMPEVMIAKCAEALAIRKAFPNDVSDVYTREEMAQQHNADGPPLATEDQVARIDELLPLVPEAVMPELKAWKAEQNISMKAGEFTAADADLVVAKLEELAHSLPVEEPTPTASAGAGDGNDKGTDDGTLTGVGASLTVPEVSDGGGFVPPAPAVGVRTGGEGSPHESDGVGIPSTVPAPTPSGVSPEPGGEPEPSEHSPAAEEPQTADSHPAAPAGPDTLKTINERAYQSLNRKCRAIHAEHGDPDKETKRVQWEALAWACSGGRTVHLGEMSPDECSVFRTRMVDVSEGRATWAESNDPAFLGWTLAYKEADQ